nr:innexin 2 [Cucujiformia]
IDNNVFRLHYKATVIVLVAFSLLVTSRQYIGDPIDCIVDEIPADVMDTYCWISATYTVPNRLTGRVGIDIAQPGVASHVDGKDEVKYHKYYQWVCFALFFQAMLFYVPRYLWKTWEGGRIKMLVLDLNCPIVNEECKQDRKRLLVDYFTTNLHMQNFYAFRFFICEVLNFVNVVGQIFFMDYFLDGEFSTYGSDVLSFTELEPEQREDPMARVFPKVTKCTFHKYGPSGTVQKFDGLCVLPVNIVNEKIY